MKKIVEAIACGIVFLLAVCIIISTIFNPFHIQHEIIFSSVTIIYIFLILLVLLFANHYEEISIGKVFELRRIIKEKEEEKENLQKRNDALINQITMMTTNICSQQNQSTLNLNGVNIETLKDLLKVKEATPEEKDENKKQREDDAREAREMLNRDRSRRWHNLRVTENKFINYSLLNKKDAQKEVKMSDVVNALDPITTEFPLLFDGHYKVGEDDVFIEVKMMASIIQRERIYIMLNRVKLYQEIKKNRASLHLIYLNVDKEGEDKIRYYEEIEKLKSIFKKSIENGLLKVEFYDKETIEEILKEQQ